MVLETTVLLKGLTFPKCPHWHDGKLWFIDGYTDRVMTVDLDANAETIVEVPGSPGGLGWLPDGRLLVVSQRDGRLLGLDREGLAEVADLSEVASGTLNDMVVDRQGRAYIGSMGFDAWAKWQLDRLGEIVLVMPGGEARVVANEIAFPNGSVLTPDGRTLIVAETSVHRLTAYRTEPDGTLTQRRNWALLGEATFPGGICLDAKGAVWVASPEKGQVLRVREGGEVTHRVGVKPKPWACTLGGPDRRTLFVLVSAASMDADEARAMKSGRIEIVQVDAPGAGPF